MHAWMDRLLGVSRRRRRMGLVALGAALALLRPAIVRLGTVSLVSVSVAVLAWA